MAAEGQYFGGNVALLGKLGVGTLNPTEKIDVDGNVSLTDNSKILIKSFLGLEKFFSIVTIDYTKNLKIDNLKINMKIDSLKAIKKNNLVKINPIKLEGKKLYRVNIIKNIGLRRIEGIKSLRDLFNINLRTAMSFYDDSGFVFSLSKTQAKYLRKIDWLKLKRV